jgi:hypothetical protein
MGLFDTIFGKKSLSPKEMDKMPAIYGGDATSPQTAATINCAAMSTAHHLIDRFISERHGQKDIDWKRGIEFFVNEPGIPEFTVRAFGVATTSGESHTYYFNVGRPMDATKKLLKMMGQMPDDM